MLMSTDGQGEPGRAILSDPWPDHVPVLTFGPRMVCTGCRIIGAAARPNLKERRRARV
jgi:hypothetical protein